MTQLDIVIRQSDRIVNRAVVTVWIVTVWRGFGSAIIQEFSSKNEAVAFASGWLLLHRAEDD